jgi:hypothetical protein
VKVCGEIAVICGAVPALTVRTPDSVLLAHPPLGEAAQTSLAPGAAEAEIVSVPWIDVLDTVPLKLKFASTLSPERKNSNAEDRFDPATVTETWLPALADVGEIEEMVGLLLAGSTIIV